MTINKRLISISVSVVGSALNGCLVAISWYHDRANGGYLLTALWSAAFLCSIISLILRVRDKART